MFSRFLFKIVVQDEVEHFRNFDDDQFDYPYELRMTVLSEIHLDLDYSTFDEDLIDTEAYYDYHYYTDEMVF